MSETCSELPQQQKSIRFRWGFCGGHDLGGATSTGHSCCGSPIDLAVPSPILSRPQEAIKSPKEKDPVEKNG